jgi:hypothetical protein
LECEDPIRVPGLQTLVEYGVERIQSRRVATVHSGEGSASDEPHAAQGESKADDEPIMSTAGASEHGERTPVPTIGYGTRTGINRYK